MIQDLISIDTIIAQAKEAGVDFGTSNPRVHLAYLAKLKLIPSALRRKMNGKLTGCYPASLVSRLQRIEELKAGGRTYSQIRFSLAQENDDLANPVQILPPSFSTETPLSPHTTSSNAFYPKETKAANHTYGVAFLMIGLILGYLVAVVRPITASPSVLGSHTSSVKEVMAAETNPKSTNPTLDPTTQEVIRIVNSSEKTSEGDQIFIISVPKEKSFSNLERTNINQLINNN